MYTIGDYDANLEPMIFISEALMELKKARTKFPTNEKQDNEDLLAVYAAFTEEVGELGKAIIQYLYEPNKNISYEDIREEAAQCLGMIIRIMHDTKLGDLNPNGRGVYPPLS